MNGPGEGPAAAPPSASAVWILAARPKTLPAAVAPVLVGMGLAAHHGVFDGLPAVAALVGAVLIQIATNLANDYYDYVRGGDTEERVGPTRVTLAAALLVGVYLVQVGGWPIVIIGLASLACAVLYTGGPFPLAYHGLGDVFVFVFFGLVAVSGTYYVQGLAWPADAFLAGVGMGALNTAILVANNLRDIETDARAGKRTLAVRLGRRGSRIEYLLLLAVAFAVPGVGWSVWGWPAAVVVAWAAMIAAAAPLRRVLGFANPAELLPALGETARVVALYGILLGGALALG
ncbi:MAG: 1,4-dihydroxy-2-naphthoate octaprenyltransferase [Gemmatimonadota bacterium]|nr:1,4-dihydroxy-2-naphthoate octaprenyltransferase [Gemmatimonadota bacterium]